jgi:putative transcriptional regulator
MDSSPIAPGLLLAMPQLVDPNFARSVVLMVEHTEEHSFGLVVNRPTPFRVAEVLSPMGIRWSGDPDAVVWFGGPVMPRSGWLLYAAEPGEVREGSIEVFPGLALSTSPEDLRAIAGAPPAHLRFLLGYAGWGAGQLEGELTQGAWLTADASRSLVLETDAERIWETALRSIGVDPGNLFAAPGVH